MIYMITVKTRQSDGRQLHTCASSKLGDDFLIWGTRIGKHYAFCQPYRDKRGASSPINRLRPTGTCGFMLVDGKIYVYSGPQALG